MKKKILILLITFVLVLTGCGKKDEVKKETAKKPEIKEEKKVKVVDLESNSRPYAVVINNYPDATRVQTGLNEAYMIYEIPIEGGMTRSLALYKDKKDVKIGTIRSARHNYIDYVKENDAIFVHFGWSHEAESQIIQMGIENIDGNYMDPKPFKRENPEGLATEHTVYTNLKDIINYNENTKKYRTTTDIKPILNYTTDEIDLSKKENFKEAKLIEIPYSWSYNVKFKYNEGTKKYDRYVNGNKHTDYFTGEQFDAKNIIVLTMDIGAVANQVDAAGNNYLDLYNIGTGNGYYITDGFAIPITWSKKDRFSKTKYLYDDKQIDISDGNTYIMFLSTNNTIAIK